MGQADLAHYFAQYVTLYIENETLEGMVDRKWINFADVLLDAFDGLGNNSHYLIHRRFRWSLVF